MKFQDLCLIPYMKAWKLQEGLREKRIQNLIEDTVLLLEHPPVFTMGKRDTGEDFLSTSEMIAHDGIEVMKSNRGGRVTYHGPGQLVGYFICSLRSVHKSVAEFVVAVEEICKRTVEAYGIQATRDPDHPGIWVGNAKIAAVGLHFSRDVSLHGFALNVAPNLMHYRHIVPCGIHDCGVTSMEALLGKVPEMQEVKTVVQKKAVELFSLLK